MNSYSVRRPGTTLRASIGLLRTLIVVDWVVVLFAAAAHLAFPDRGLSPRLRDYVQLEDAQPLDGLAIARLLLAATWPALSLVSSIGVLLLWRRARALFAVAVLTGPLLTLLTGPSVMPAFGAAADEISLTLSGVALALLYFSDIRHAFELQRRPSSGAVSPELPSR
jgi:hypothetical protein